MHCDNLKRIRPRIAYDTENTITFLRNLRQPVANYELGRKNPCGYNFGCIL